MPLTPGASPSKTIPELHTGKTYAHTLAKYGKRDADRQAVAIALSNQRKGRAIGGVANFDTGGATDPVNAIIQALQQGAGSGVGSPGTTSTPSTTPNTTNPAAPSSPTATAASSPTGIAPTPNAITTAATAQAALPGVVQQNMNPANPIAQKLLNTGGVANRAMGGFDVAKSANLRPPPYQRQEYRNLHIGPVLSMVPGRTDNHPIKVPSGSYVLPAAHVSSIGKGNTNAGFKIAARMYGMGHRLMQSTGHGMGMQYASEGGARGDERHPGHVDVNVSGGEFIIPPWKIIAKHGSLKKGHQALDKWIMDTRAREIKTLKNLPPPAKK